ncbi:MAG: Stp1/IreP family PP2C-type Ser/Thr phosphatase [Anaerolineae bacterium]|nr:Stp1/IreP family PP2C-type Ser/Thr phosphatase [Anaerolineae bacterium]
MDFLRRILGWSTGSETTPPKDDIIITQGDTEPASPPEPIIETPANAQPPAEASTTLAQAGEEEVSLDKAQTAPIMTPVAGTRQLPPLETVVPRPGQRLTFGQLSDIGMVRGNNQDAVFSIISSSISSDDLPDFGLFIVADGMGGHHDGEKASAITVRTIANYVTGNIFHALTQKQMDDEDRPTITDVLLSAVQKANEAVTDLIPEGGTTVTTTVIMGDRAYIAHVGDSRAYLINDEGIEQITRDHSLVQRLIELDQLTPEEAAEHPQRNVLYRAIGQNDNLDVDAITRRLLPRSCLLLCSDGLWNLIPEDVIRNVVSKHDNPQHACHELVDMANDRGGPDNITVIIVEIPG